MFFCFLLGTMCSYSQSNTDINPFRIGVRGGVPTGVGLEFEYATPLLQNRIAPFISYGMFPFVDDYEFSFFEVGSNIYFGSKGKGGYVVVSYGDLNAEVSNLSGETDSGERFENGESKEQLSSFNLKLGWKYGSTLYFRIEGGYAFGKLPQTLEVTGDVNGNRETFYYTYGDDVFDYISGNGYAMLTLGIGYSF